MRRLQNGDFTHLMGQIHTLLQHHFENLDTNLFDHELNNFVQFNSELQKMRPVQTSHRATELIRRKHNLRVKRLTIFLQHLSHNATAIHLSSDEQEKWQLIYNLMSAYGNRYYDMGISNVTGKLNWIIEDVNNSPQVQDVINSIHDIRDYYNSLVKLNKEIVEAQLTRALDNARVKSQRRYVDVRKDVYDAFRMLLVRLYYLQSHAEYKHIANSAHSIIGQCFAEYKPALLQAEKRREKMKERANAKPQGVATTPVS